MERNTDATDSKVSAETGSQADKFVRWHLDNAPQPWTPNHAKSYLRSLVERDIYNKLCSIEQFLRKGKPVSSSTTTTTLAGENKEQL